MTYALAELDALHSKWPETLQCNIVIERARLLVATADEADLSDEPHFHAQVELDLGRRSPRVRARALHSDAYAALRTAFGDLRNAMPDYSSLARGETPHFEASHNDYAGHTDASHVTSEVAA